MWKEKHNGLHPAALSILLALSPFFFRYPVPLSRNFFPFLFLFFLFGAKHYVLLPARSTDGTALNIPVELASHLSSR